MLSALQQPYPVSHSVNLSSNRLLLYSSSIAHPEKFLCATYTLTFKFNNDHRIGYKTSEPEVKYEVAEFDPFYIY